MSAVKDKVLMQFDNTSDATYDAWATAIEDAIIAMGWTATSDTGNTDPHSNPARPTANNYKFRIYKAADSFAGTQDIYLRFDYGSQSSQTNPSMKFQVGTATDGAGTLTGFTSTQQTIPATGNASQAVQRPLWYCGTTGRLCLWFDGNSTAHQILVCVERSKDSTGADSAIGFTYIGMNATLSSSASQQSEISYADGTVVEITTANVPLPYMTMSSGGASTTLFNGKVPVGYWFPIPGVTQNPLVALMAVTAVDIAQGAVGAVTHYGSSANYVRTATRNDSTAPLMRWNT